MKLKELILVTILSTATLFAGFTTVDCSNQSHLVTLQIPQIECEALEALWDETGHEDWVHTDNWDMLISTEEWYGITLNDDNRSVKRVIMQRNNLSGELPEKIGDFTNLQSLAITDNTNFGGDIPDSINNLTSLEAIGLFNNSFVGPLPKFTSLVNLMYIFLSGNKFDGNIPEEYIQFSKLEKVYLDENNLSGPVPDFSHAKNLMFIDIRENSFTFKDIEPQGSWLFTDPLKFAYAPQSDINETEHIVYFDDTLIIEPRLEANPSGNDNYIWRKNSLEIGHSRVFIKNNATVEDMGYYSYDVNNSIVTDVRYEATNLVLHSNSPIYATHNTPPSIANLTPIKSVSVDDLYTYTSTISDTDDDPLIVRTNLLPSWLTLTSNNGTSFTIEGTPGINELGSYDINITVVDLDRQRNNTEKMPVYISYTLHVTPAEASLPAGFTFENGIYTHTKTKNTLSGEGALTIINDGLELVLTCVNNKKVYIALDNAGVLTTGFKDCTTDVLSETFIDTLSNDTNTSIVTNNAEKMILIELHLNDDMTLGGN